MTTALSTLPALAESSQLLPAREQMAFTLGCHIILVPFGVAFTFSTMIANYRAIRRDDVEAPRRRFRAAEPVPTGAVPTS